MNTGITDSDTGFDANTTPTQVVHPWRATLRTIVQTAAGIILAVFTAILFLAVFLPQLLAAVVDVLPPDWAAQAAAVVGWIVLVAGAVTRIMAIPGVNDWLTRWRMGAAPRPPLDAGTAGENPSNITNL